MTEEIKPSFAVNFPSDFRKAITEAEKYLSDVKAIAGINHE